MPNNNNIVELRFDVTKQDITRTDENVVASGAIKTIKCNFHFCNVWHGLYKFCRFEGASGIHDVRLEDDDSCIVPWEVIEAPSFTMACYGTLSSDVMLTTRKHYVKVYQSINFIEEEALPIDETPNLVRQYEQIVENAVDEFGGIVNNAVDEFNTQVEHAFDVQEQNNLDQQRNNTDQARNNAGVLGMQIRQLEAGEYNPETKVPTIEGELGIVYLVPMNPADVNSESYKFVWNGEVWENIGTTDINIEGFAHVNNDGAVVSVGADYAEYGTWADGNPNGEDRRGYFVTMQQGTNNIKKAVASSAIVGVTTSSAGFIGNYTEGIESNPAFGLVGVVGQVSVIDNGTCTVGNRCMPNDNGTASPSSNNCGYLVIERVDSSHVKILVSPAIDMIQRIRTDVSDLKDYIDDAIDDKLGILETRAY